MLTSWPETRPAAGRTERGCRVCRPNQWTRPRRDFRRYLPTARRRHPTSPPLRKRPRHARQRLKAPAPDLPARRRSWPQRSCVYSTPPRALPDSAAPRLVSPVRRVQVRWRRMRASWWVRSARYRCRIRTVITPVLIILSQRQLLCGSVEVAGTWSRVLDSRYGQTHDDSPETISDRDNHACTSRER